MCAHLSLSCVSHECGASKSFEEEHFMEADAARKIALLTAEVDKLKTALIQVSNALRQYQLYVVNGDQPTERGIEMLEDYLRAIDRAVHPAGLSGLRRP
jgi:hypothetical protein